MGFLSKLFRARNEITTGMTLGDVVSQVYGGPPSASGVSVTPDSAMRCATVFACIRVLAESVAQLPRHVYRKTEDAKQRDDAHPLHWLLNVAPNSWQTSFEFFELGMTHLGLRGNFFAWKNRLSNGKVWELIPLRPDRMQVKQNDNWSLSYTYTPDGKAPWTLTSKYVLHVRGLGCDGVTGMSPVTQAREAVGLALVTEKHGAKLFSNGAHMKGMLKHPGKLSDPAAKRLRASFEENNSGTDNAFRTALLEEGMDWVSVGMSSDDAQFLETRKYQRGEIASMFRVPPHMIGDLERATFSNIEQQSIEFVTRSLMPWLKRWEQAITRDLITPADQGKVYVEFNADALLRGDTLSRYQAYGQAIKDGWMNRNEVRAKENLNAEDGLDDFLTPLNMAKGTDPTPPENKPADPNAPDPATVKPAA